ncbi:hypothetical protein M0802_000164 [Mischocyttarus mexicanus]|nr:hypothetical protein M0802_000164 [Mischocyttarus mexicanus]
MRRVLIDHGPFPRSAPREAALTDPLARNNAFTSSLSGPLWTARLDPFSPTLAVAAAAVTLPYLAFPYTTLPYPDAVAVSAGAGSGGGGGGSGDAAADTAVLPILIYSPTFQLASTGWPPEYCTASASAAAAAAAAAVTAAAVGCKIVARLQVKACGSTLDTNSDTTNTPKLHCPLQQQDSRSQASLGIGIEEKTYEGSLIFKTYLQQ